MTQILYYFVVTALSYAAFTVLLFILHAAFYRQTPIFGFLARCMCSYASAPICAVYGIIASLALRLVGAHRLVQWTAGRAFAYTMWLTTGVRFDVISGKEYLSTIRPAVLIGNHQTELDVVLLGQIFPKWCSVTAKKSLSRIPFLGWFMVLSGTVFIDRVDRAKAMKAFEGAAKEMRTHRQSVFIFPEGTRSHAREPGLLPFKKGAFHLAVQAGVPIVPVVAENYSQVLDVKARRFTAGRIRVKVLEPIKTEGLTASDVDELARATREKMLNVIREMAQDPGAKTVGRHGGAVLDGAVKASGVDIKH